MYFIVVDRCHGRALNCGKLERHTGTGVYVTASGAGITRIRVQFSSISLVVAGTRCPPALLVSAFRLQPSLPYPSPSFPFPGIVYSSRVCKFAVDHKSLLHDSKVIPVIAITSNRRAVRRGGNSWCMQRVLYRIDTINPANHNGVARRCIG